MRLGSSRASLRLSIASTYVRSVTFAHGKEYIHTSCTLNILFWRSILLGAGSGDGSRNNDAKKCDMCDDVRMSYPHSSPLIRGAVFDDAPPVTPRASSVYRRPIAKFASSPLQRKGAWASPSVALSPEEKSTHDLGHPEPRENTWWDVWEQLPSVLMGSVQSMWMDLEALVHEQEMGCPIGACMHVISLGSQLLLPGTSFLFTQQSMQRQAHSHLFASPPSTARRPNDSHAAGSYSTYIGRLVVQRRTAALSYMVS